MKWTVAELTKRGKDVNVVEVSAESADISGIPNDVENIVIGVTKLDPAVLIGSLQDKGFKNFWVHWRTDTPAVQDICGKSDCNCTTGKCSMMYLGNGFSIHGIHRYIAKLMSNY
jgi:hypothetical protein